MASSSANKSKATKNGADRNKRSSRSRNRGSSNRRSGTQRANMSATIQWLALVTIFVLVVVAFFAFGDDSGLGGQVN